MRTQCLYFSPQYTSSLVTVEDEVVVEILSQSSGTKGVMWVGPSKGPCKLEELKELKSMFAIKRVSVPVRTSPIPFLKASQLMTKGRA